MRPRAPAWVVPTTLALATVSVLRMWAFSKGAQPSAADAVVLGVIAMWLVALERERHRGSRAQDVAGEATDPVLQDRCTPTPPSDSRAGVE